MSTPPDPRDLLPVVDEVIAARLSEWAIQDAAIGLAREAEMLRSLKEHAEMRLMERDVELRSAREQLSELETSATESAIRLTECQEVLSSLQAERSGRREALSVEAATQAVARCRAAVSRLTRRLFR